jgi:serine/threonine protein kinase
MVTVAGTRFNHYVILSPLGAGGMGEVYRARDTRLNREVAIKVLPASFANDTDRLRRFEQEAQATSALNHPNILTIYDIGTHERAPFIVAELLEGEELRAQLEQGVLPVYRAIEYARQITAGLAAAHEKGIVHRDLKPENLFITGDGRVKILDFGLAKLKPQHTNPVDSQVPTQQKITDPGTVMGTVGYMSPEQVRGQEADTRSDIFSFGMILYEMLSGRRPFDATSVADVMSAILKDDPPELSETNAKISPALDKIVRRCLEKKPQHRFQSAHDLGFALETLTTPSGSHLETGAAFPSITQSARGSRMSRRERLAWLLAACFLLALLAALPFAVIQLRRSPANAEAIRFFIPPPEGSSFDSSAISPDGRQLAFIATAQGKRLLWVRPLNALTAQPLPGTEDALNHFWSPDSRSLGFLTGSKLKKIDLAGGLPQILCDTTSRSGGTWNREDMIIFGANGGLLGVSATGGTVFAVTKSDQTRQEISHGWPYFLPDGRHFVLSISSPQPEHRGIYLGSLDKGPMRRLVPDYSNAAWAASAEGGWLLFVRRGALLAQPFDTRKMSLMGEPFPLAEQVSNSLINGRGAFSVSENGVLVYASGTSWNTQLVWLDRSGKELSVASPPGNHVKLRLSPDDRRLVLERDDPQTGNKDLWVRDLSRGVTTRFTFDPSNDSDPIWSPDGSRIVWSSNRNGRVGLYQKSASGMGQDELLLSSENYVLPRDWSTDERFIVYIKFDPKTFWDVWGLPLAGERKPFLLVQSPYSEGAPRLSPDGRWLAYRSSESGREEVYVTTFPSPSAKWQISSGGGAQPHWQHDGKELYYVAADSRLMAVQVESAAASKADFAAGVPQALFETRLPYASMRDIDFYDVAADGRRFLINTPVDEVRAMPLTVVVNWAAGVKK